MATEEPLDPLIDKVLVGKYRVVRVIGSGGMATVYEARHIEIGKRVAVKVLHEELAVSSGLIERFLREARAAAAIESPNICQVHDVDRLPEGRPFLVMELLLGESLFERLNRVTLLTPAQTAQIVVQVARGLAKAHDQDILHRDLKPENIFLARDEEGTEIAKLLDFGLARFYAPTGVGQSPAAIGAQTRLTRDGMIFGTPPYMSPEQVTGEGKIDHRSDLWALACIVFECLTGRGLWNSDRGVAMVLAQIAVAPLPVPSQLRPELPRAFDSWLVRALDRDPEKRFQSAREFARELASTLGFDTTRASFASAASWLEPSGVAPIITMPMPQIEERVPAVQESKPLDLPASPAAENLQTAPPAVPIADSLGSEPHGRPMPQKATSKQRRSSRTPLFVGIGSLLFLTAFLAVSATLWLQKHPQAVSAQPTASLATPTQASSAPSSPIASSGAESPASASFGPSPNEQPWQGLLRQAQEAVAKSDMAGGLKALERATELNDSGAMRSLLEHLRIAAANQGSCKLTGLGRPRPADRRSASRQGPLGAVQPGWLATWFEERKGQGSAGLSTTLLDSLLSASTPRDLDLQANNIVSAQLQSMDKGSVLLFGEGSGATPGLYLVGFDSLGQPSGTPVRVADGRTCASNGALLHVGQDLWLAYAEDPDRLTSNMYARKLDTSFQGPGPVQLTRFVGVHGPLGARALGPALAVSGDQLVLSYRVERGQEHDLLYQRIALSDSQLSTGLSNQDKPSQEATLGTIVRVTQTRLKVRFPSLACDAKLCLVAWQSEPRGAHVVAIDSASGAVLWRKVASPLGTQPSVAMTSNGRGLIAWYESGRLRVSPLGKAGVEPPSTIARQSGDQPSPTILSIPQGWLVAWTTFEAGHPEPYVARLECPNE